MLFKAPHLHLQSHSGGLAAGSKAGLVASSKVGNLFDGWAERQSLCSSRSHVVALHLLRLWPVL